MKPKMDRDEIEALLRQKYEAGEADTGLYSTGLQFVVMDMNEDGLTFQWFAGARDFGDLL